MCTCLGTVMHICVGARGFLRVWIYIVDMWIYMCMWAKRINSSVCMGIISVYVYMQMDLYVCVYVWYQKNHKTSSRGRQIL